MITVEKYSPKHLDATVAALAAAFVTNPLHLSAFGPDRLDRNRFFFREGLRHMFTGPAFIALDGGEVVGYVHYNASPLCLPAPEALPAFAAEHFRPLEDAVPRVIEWFSRWAHLDPKEPHAHLGPIGVVPAYQRGGVGRALMSRYVEHLDGEKIEGYLETDRAGNVEFYKKFGFTVVREQQVIGVPTWYMRRAAR